MSQCTAVFRVTSRICGQYCYCVRELGHEGFCMAIHYGWPFHWLRSTGALDPSSNSESIPS